MARDVALKKALGAAALKTTGESLWAALAYETEICQKVTEAIMKNDLLLL